jgi:hypothetical protein
MMDGHTRALLSSIANAAFQHDLAQQMANPFPFLGMVRFACSKIDVGMLRKNIESTRGLYSELRGDWHKAELVSVFALSDTCFPAVMPPFKTMDSKAADVYMEAITDARYKLFVHLDALRDMGCFTACVFQHDGCQQQTGNNIHQVGLFVPAIRVSLDADGKIVSEPNTKDQVTFISYLEKAGLISFTTHREQIIAATSCRVLDLAQKQRASEVENASQGKKKPSRPPRK